MERSLRLYGKVGLNLQLWDYKAASARGKEYSVPISAHPARHRLPSHLLRDRAQSACVHPMKQRYGSLTQSFHPRDYRKASHFTASRLRRHDAVQRGFDKFANGPDKIRNATLHGGCDAQGLGRAARIVVGEIERNRCTMVQVDVAETVDVNRRCDMRSVRFWRSKYDVLICAWTRTGYSGQHRPVPDPNTSWHVNCR
jgi:hypothetical protein